MAESVSLKERIELSLGIGAKTELADDLGTTPATVRDKLNQYRDKAFIQLDSTNREAKWGLLAGEDYEQA
jgi:hypothetical protein